jgi:peroxiredoxin
MRKIFLIACGVRVAIAGVGYSAYYEVHTVHRSGEAPASTAKTTDAKMKRAPDFTLRTLEGRSLKLSDFRGKVVLVNFWATWCGPCRVEMPMLVESYERYHSQGLEILGISMDDAGQEKQVADFVTERNVQYPILLGNSEVAGLYGGVRFMPESFLVDQNGNLVETNFGIENKDSFEQGIRQLLNAKGHQ